MNVSKYSRGERRKSFLEVVQIWGWSLLVCTFASGCINFGVVWVVVFFFLYVIC